MRVVGTASITLPQPGPVEFDNMNRSTVSVFVSPDKAEELVWAAGYVRDPGAAPGRELYTRSASEIGEVRTGDLLVLSIPSGTLRMAVAGVSARDGAQEASGPAEWDGSLGGLRGGMSGVGNFHFHPGHGGQEPVTTSSWPAPVPWSTCLHVHELADAAVGWDCNDRAVAVRVAQTRIYAALFAMYPALAECSEPSVAFPMVGYVEGKWWLLEQRLPDKEPVIERWRLWSSSDRDVELFADAIIPEASLDKRFRWLVRGTYERALEMVQHLRGWRAVEPGGLYTLVNAADGFREYEISGDALRLYEPEDDDDVSEITIIDDATQP